MKISHDDPPFIQKSWASLGWSVPLDSADCWVPLVLSWPTAKWIADNPSLWTKLANLQSSLLHEAQVIFHPVTGVKAWGDSAWRVAVLADRSEEHTSELQSF